MKSIILLFSIVVLFISSALADYDPQYVSKVSGDTLFVKDDADFGGGNTLPNLMKSDSMAPATRVYMLKEAGTYSCQNNPQSSKNYRTIIMGPEQNIKTGTIFPPVVSGMYGAGIGAYGGMTCNKDLLVKNIDLEIGNAGGNGGGWAFFYFGGPNMRLQVDNCIMEHTWWCWVGGPPALSVVKFTNDYFVNLNGHNCRRNGGVVDFNSGSAFLQDTLLVENCTHVNTQGTLYKFRHGYTINRVIFNHNNFIDCSGYVIMNHGHQTNLSITNNVYVNCQLQAFCPVLSKADIGEVDADGLPMGLINLRVDSTSTTGVYVDRNVNYYNPSFFMTGFVTHGVYVEKNVIYWDPSLSDIDSTLNTNQVNGSTEWVSQMIIMNTRTATLFANWLDYYNLTNGKWINKLPNFKKTDVLFSTQLAALKAFSMATVDTAYGTPLPSWRQPSNEEASNYIYADWPIPIDLSYTDADLLDAGLGGFPIGDLGWFPSQLAAWKVQKAYEYAGIQYMVDNGSFIVNSVAATEHPGEFQLQQNYPNPFNPSTDINYTISKSGNVTLKVYNMLGQDVATLVDGYQAANTYKVNFNASGLSSGVYLYELRTGSNVITRKMVLMK